MVMTSTPFTGLVGEIAVELKMLSTQEQQDIATYQATAMKILETENTNNVAKEDRTNLYSGDISALQERAEALNISKEQIDEAAQSFSASNNVPWDVPNYLKAATIMPEVSINKGDDMPILATQSASRTLSSLEQSAQETQPIALEESNIAGLINNPRAPSELARDFIGKYDSDPKYIVAAQATEHVAAIIGEAIKIDPTLRENTDITKGINALETFAANTLKSAAENFTSIDKPEAAQEVMNVAEPIIENKKFQLKTAKDETLGNNIAQALETAAESLQNAGLSQEQAGDLSTLAKNRTEQILLEPLNIAKNINERGGK